jgi:hypothetical protein
MEGAGEGEAQEAADPKKASAAIVENGFVIFQALLHLIMPALLWHAGNGTRFSISVHSQKFAKD